MATTTNDSSRRKFLAACGRFAVVTPPAITLMLAASRQNYATAASGGVSRDEPDFCGITTPTCHPEVGGGHS